MRLIAVPGPPLNDHCVITIEEECSPDEVTSDKEIPDWGDKVKGIRRNN